MTKKLQNDVQAFAEQRAQLASQLKEKEESLQEQVSKLELRLAEASEALRANRELQAQCGFTLAATARDRTPNEALKAARIERGLTQAALAERAGLSILTISGLESGRTVKPRQATLQALQTGLGLESVDAVRALFPALAGV